MTRTSVVVRGTGHYLPDRALLNEEFERTLDTNDEWIRTRTGIRKRHFAAPGECTSDLAIMAGKEALADAELDGKDVDLIVLATSTPDNTFPSTATRVQAELGMVHGYGFDLQAVCAGFVFALANASALLRAGEARRALVIGAETFSRILDMSDRSTCILFGDGAGAVLLEVEESDSSDEPRGVLSTDIHSDGCYRDLLFVDGGVSSTGTIGYVRMNGKEVFRHAVVKLVDSAKAALDKAGLKAQDIDWLVPHQANKRILAKMADRLGVEESRVVVTVQDHGNTSAASIPIALSTARSQGRIKNGDLVLMNAIGGGLAWGAVVVRW